MPRKTSSRRHSEISEAGYAVIDREALEAAPHEIALRALSQLIGAVGGGEMPVQLAKLENLLAALHAGSRQGPYARPLPARALLGPSRHLPRDAGQGAARGTA